mmetsp:Transcript_7098/g.19025  ORF Transcript_7098/g.19025 Transcript_7098/m.19025 type:complete len:247 (+) Transcript_7098:81-821(+)
MMDASEGGEATATAQAARKRDPSSASAWRGAEVGGRVRDTPKSSLAARAGEAPGTNELQAVPAMNERLHNESAHIEKLVSEKGTEIARLRREMGEWAQRVAELESALHENGGAVERRASLTVGRKRAAQASRRCGKRVLEARALAEEKRQARKRELLEGSKYSLPAKDDGRARKVMQNKMSAELSRFYAEVYLKELEDCLNAEEARNAVLEQKLREVYAYAPYAQEIEDGRDRVEILLSAAKSDQC